MSHIDVWVFLLLLFKVHWYVSENVTDSRFLCFVLREIDKGVDLCSLLYIAPMWAFPYKCSQFEWVYYITQNNNFYTPQPEWQWGSIENEFADGEKCRNCNSLESEAEVLSGMSRYCSSCYFSKEAHPIHLQFDMRVFTFLYHITEESCHPTIHQIPYLIPLLVTILTLCLCTLPVIFLVEGVATSVRYSHLNSIFMLEKLKEDWGIGLQNTYLK